MSSEFPKQKLPYEKPEIKKAGKMVDGIFVPERQPSTPEPPKPNLEDENLVEKELSPEQIEKVMEKVQDINKYGTAYRSLGDISKLRDNNALQELLADGLLGTDFLGLRTSENTKEQYERMIKSGSSTNPIIYFNIMGRSHGVKDFSKGYGLVQPDKKGNLTVIFDINNLRETFVEPSMSHRKDSLKPGQYANDDEMSDNKPYYDMGLKPGDNINAPDTKHTLSNKKPFFNSNGDSIADTDWGFVTPNQISPEKLKGLIIGSTLLNDVDLDYISKTMKEEFRASEQELVLLPIYDSDGNLLWPKPMSYQEVKKFVEERDKEKEEKI